MKILAATALMLTTGVVATTSCEIPTSCEGAIGIAFHDQPPSVVSTMRRIAWRESRNQPGARNSSSSAVGCFQLLRIHAARAARMGFPWSAMTQALPNALVARSLYMEQGLAPWAT